MTTLPAEPAVAALWRYPVKSMQGEELNASEVTAAGLVGDRGFALMDQATGKVAGAKNPRKWPGFFQFRASYVTTPAAGETLPAVRVTLPDGTCVTSDEAGIARRLSAALGRDVALAAAAAPDLGPPMAEGYDVDSDEVLDFEMPAGTFFDCAPVHIVTTATLDRLRSLYPAGRFEPRRFRPNIIVDTGPDTAGFAENAWVGRTVAVGGSVRLRVFKTTGRCVMTTLPQYDLPKDPGILHAAVRHNDAAVGVYARVLAGGTIRRGDAVTVL
jgi:uncharacterized protein YcbX